MQTETPVLTGWWHRCDADAAVPVLPDGCRDVILRGAPGVRPVVFASPLQDAPKTVSLRRGDWFLGRRLRPGLRIDMAAIAALGQDAVRALCDGQALPEPVLRRDPGIEEALAAIGRPGVTVRRTAADLGVALRTLQRHVVEGSGRPPVWWRRLGRARRAGRDLAAGTLPAAEIALTHGYADQAHLSREIRCWFGASPTRLRGRRSLIAPLLEPGYGTDQPAEPSTGEHNSTR